MKTLQPCAKAMQTTQKNLKILCYFYTWVFAQTLSHLCAPRDSLQTTKNIPHTHIHAIGGDKRPPYPVGKSKRSPMAGAQSTETHTHTQERATSVNSMKRTNQKRFTYHMAGVRRTVLHTSQRRLSFFVIVRVDQQR